MFFWFERLSRQPERDRARSQSPYCLGEKYITSVLVKRVKGRERS